MPKNENILILIVDDNPQNIQLLASMLNKNGYKIAIAKSGMEAIRFTSKKLPDIVLLDVMMPEMDGFEVCETLKKCADTKHIPIIFLTAKTEMSTIVKCFEIGGADYVSKPFNFEELLARIQTQVRLKKAFDEIKTLRGIIPICANCKNIRKDDGSWELLELYIQEHSEAIFSHGICDTCAEKLYPEL